MELNQFTGTQQYFKSNMFVPKMVHTEGVQYFCDKASAYWFLDIVATEFFKLQEVDYFLSIKMVVADGKATITVEDGDCKVLKTKHIEFTDCPEGEYEFFLTDNVLMLTSEY